MRKRFSVLAVLVAVFMLMNSVAVNAIVEPIPPSPFPIPVPLESLVIVDKTQEGVILNVSYDLDPLADLFGVEIVSVTTDINGNIFNGDIVNLDVTTLGIPAGSTVQTLYTVQLQQVIDFGFEEVNEPDGDLELDTLPPGFPGVPEPLIFHLPPVIGSYDVTNPLPPANLWIAADDAADVYINGSLYTTNSSYSAAVEYLIKHEDPFFAAKAWDRTGEANIAGFKLVYADDGSSFISTDSSWYYYYHLDEGGQPIAPPNYGSLDWNDKNYVGEGWLPVTAFTLAQAPSPRSWAPDSDFPDPSAKWIWAPNFNVGDGSPSAPAIDTPVYLRSMRPLKELVVTVEAEGYPAEVKVNDEFPSDTVVEGNDADLFAPEVEGYDFIGWYDGEVLVSEDPEPSPDIYEDKTFTAKYQIKTFVVTVTANPVAGGNPVVITSPVDYDGSVQLKAQTAANYNFVKWTLDGVDYSTNKNITVTNVQDNLDFVAHYTIKRFTIEVISTDGGDAGLELPLVGNPVGTPSEVTADYNTLITMTATEPSIGYRFVGWYRVDGNKNDFKTSNPILKRRTNDDKTFEARYVELGRYAISARYNSEHVGVYGLGTEFYDGSENNVQVSAFNGNTFINSVTIYKVVEGVETQILFDDTVNNGDIFVIDDPLDLEELADYVVEVDSTTTYTVYTFSQDEALGTTDPLEQSVVDEPEVSEFVTINANPTSGNRFVGWYIAERKQIDDEYEPSGPASELFTLLVSTDENYTPEVNGDIRFMGVFEPIPVTPPTVTEYTLTVNVVGDGSVPGFQGTNTFTSGTNVNLSAVISDALVTEFEGWSGDLTSTDTDVLVVVNGNKTITATFVDIIEEEPVPEDVPEETEEEILDEETPESAPDEIEDETLPQSGGVPASMISMLGVGLAGFGFKIRKRK